MEHPIKTCFILLCLLVCPLPQIQAVQETARDILDQDLFALKQKALTAHHNGEFTKALPHYLELLKYNRRNPTTLYNLACCYARLGEVKLGMDCLWQSVQNGFSQADLIEKDGDFQAIKEKALFRITLENIQQYLRDIGSLQYLVAPKLIPYRMRLPKAYPAEKPFSVVIALHGNGGNPLTFQNLAELFDDENMILVMPQGAYTHPQDGMLTMSQYTFGLPSRDRSIWQKADQVTSEYIAELSRELRLRYAIDKIYLLGFSEGGVFAYQTALIYPDLFAAIIVFGAPIPEMNQPWSLLNLEKVKLASTVKVFIGHGEDDPAVSVDEARKAYKILNDNGFTVRIRTVPGGHGIPPQLLREALNWTHK